MNITEAAFVCDELCCLEEEEEEKRVRDRKAFLSMLTVRVVVLEYNQLHKKA